MGVRTKSSYHDYEKYGGDCTNFISQCLHAGEIPFDESGRDITTKWYWYSDYSRTPTWTAAKPLETYLLNNNKKGTKNYGIYASLCEYDELRTRRFSSKTNEWCFNTHDDRDFKSIK